MNWCLLAATSALLAAAMSTAANAQDTASPGQLYLRTPQLLVSVTPTDGHGRTHGGKSVWLPLTSGDTIDYTLRIGNPDGDLCAYQLRDENAGAFNWTITPALVEAGVEGATVDVALKRSNRSALGPAMDRRRIYEFREGE